MPCFGLTPFFDHLKVQRGQYLSLKQVFDHHDYLFQ